jgi:hypothetical protein
VSCKHHLSAPPARQTQPTPEELDVMERRILHHMETSPETCALDVADRNESPTFVEVGRLIGPRRLSRERVRQLEQRALVITGGEVRRRRLVPEQAIPDLDDQLRARARLRRGGENKR